MRVLFVGKGKGGFMERTVLLIFIVITVGLFVAMLFMPLRNVQTAPPNLPSVVDAAQGNMRSPELPGSSLQATAPATGAEVSSGHLFSIATLDGLRWDVTCGLSGHGLQPGGEGGGGCSVRNIGSLPFEFSVAARVDREELSREGLAELLTLTIVASVDTCEGAHNIIYSGPLIADDLLSSLAPLMLIPRDRTKADTGSSFLFCFSVRVPEDLDQEVWGGSHTFIALDFQFTEFVEPMESQ